MSTLNSRGFLSALCGAVLLALAPGLASATLGEPEVSVQADSAKLQSSVKMTDQSLFRVHEMTLDTGTVVREFVALDGKVFAVSWRGPYMPNLRQALGKYFDVMTSAPRNSSSFDTQATPCGAVRSGVRLRLQARTFMSNALA